MRPLTRPAAVLLPVLLLGAAPVDAQQYPDKPVRIIVPTAPGGGSDLIGRVLAQKLTETLGQQFIVDNRGGAGTTIGSALVAKSPPDGYTLLLNHVSFAFNASYYRRLPYDTLKDFAPISLVATQPFLLVVHPSLPIKSVKELVVLAKRQPGRITYGSGGAGSGPHMAVELLKHAAAIDLLHVPYKGAGPAFADLMGGQIQMMIATMSLALPHASSGKVRPLAITSAQRHPAAPGLPTVAESGVPNYQFDVWYGLFAPAGTPPPIVQRLNETAAKILQSAEMREKLAGQGLRTTSNSPHEFATHLRREVETWEKVVKATRLHAD